MLVLPMHTVLLDSSPNAWMAADDSEGDDSSLGELVQRFEVNEPVGAFLGVTALVSALIFAAAYSEAHSRLDEIRNSLTLEANGVHTAMLLVRTLDAGNDAHQTRALLLFAAYIEQLSEEIASGCPTLNGETVSPAAESSSNIETLYAAVPYLSKISNGGQNDEIGINLSAGMHLNAIGGESLNIRILDEGDFAGSDQIGCAGVEVISTTALAVFDRPAAIVLAIFQPESGGFQAGQQGRVDLFHLCCDDLVGAFHDRHRHAGIKQVPLRQGRAVAQINVVIKLR